MQIVVGHKQWRQKRMDKASPGATVVDVTSKAEMPWVRFSPFYPHGNIPIPFSDGAMGQSVEGIWQGLKVFDSADIDSTTFENTTMKRLKRTERRFGKTRGHRKGINGDELLDYLTARLQIYLPIYRFVLDNYLQTELNQLRAIIQQTPLILLDYETNIDVYNLSKPLSHAGLVKAYLEERYPSE